MKKDIVAGIGLGLLIGTIIGLSIAQTTGIVLGALTALLAAFFGLKPKKENESLGNKTIIGSFSVACTVFIIIGLYVRANRILSPSLEQEVIYYQKAGFSSKEIKKIILIKQLGIIPDGVQFNLEAKTYSEASVLMSDNQNSLKLCESIKDDSSLEEIKEAYTYSGIKHQQLEIKLSKAIASDEELKTILLTLKEMLCE